MFIDQLGAKLFGPFPLNQFFTTLPRGGTDLMTRQLLFSQEFPGRLRA